ncbi:MAG: ice-binding family protein [Chitinophagaceae bacterium]
MKRFLLTNRIIILFVVVHIFIAATEPPVQVDLGIAADFTLFSSAGAITNTGTTTIFGDIGTHAGDISGFENPCTVYGDMMDTDPTTLQCSIDLANACTQINDIPVTNSTHSVIFGGGETLLPGVYSTAAAASIDGNLILDAQGDAHAVFIFKIGGAFTTTAGASVTLINNASASNIFFKAAGAIAMATNTVMRGTMISNDGAVSMGAGGILEGRMLSNAGAVSTYQVMTYQPGSVVVLPIKLSSFSGSFNGESVNLTWVAESTSALDKFEIERSDDGRNFSYLSGITATEDKQTYTWTDRHVSPALHHYRLKMIDQDGSFSYSSIVSIDVQQKQSISIWPNPVTGGLVNLKMTGQQAGKYFISIINSKGEVLQTTRVHHNGQGAETVPVKLSNPANALCYVQVTAPDGNATNLKIITR